MRSLVLVCLSLALFTPPGAAQQVDTLWFGDQPVIHENPYGWGYISGTNGYLDRGKYERYDWFGETYLVAARIYFGVKRIANTPDVVRIVARDADLSGKPGTLLDEVALTTDQLDTTGAGNLVVFPHPPLIKSEGFMADTFFIGIEWVETEDDTFAVFADPAGFGDGADRVWECIDDPNNAGTYTMWSWVDPGDWSWHLDSDLWIKAILSSSPAGVVSDARIPARLSLTQNYPNPFNPSTRIAFTVPERGDAALRVYSLLGEEVATLYRGEAHPGTSHTVVFDATHLPSGAYFARLRTTAGTLTRAMLLAK